MQVPEWISILPVDKTRTKPPFPIESVSDDKPPPPLHESQCRSFMPYTLTRLDGKPPSSPFSNMDTIKAPNWIGPLPDNEEHLGRYFCT